MGLVGMSTAVLLVIIVSGYENPLTLILLVVLLTVAAVLYGLAVTSRFRDGR